MSHQDLGTFLAWIIRLMFYILFFWPPPGVRTALHLEGLPPNTDNINQIRFKVKVALYFLLQWIPLPVKTQLNITEVLFSFEILFINWTGSLNMTQLHCSLYISILNFIAYKNVSMDNHVKMISMTWQSCQASPTSAPLLSISEVGSLVWKYVHWHGKLCDSISSEQLLINYHFLLQWSSCILLPLLSLGPDRSGECEHCLVSSSRLISISHLKPLKMRNLCTYFWH